MKKFFQILSVLVIAGMALSACGGATQTPAATQPPATQPPATTAPATEAPTTTTGGGATGTCPLEVEDGATIVFSGWGDETEQKIYRDSIDRFSKVCPGVTVNYQPIPDKSQDK